MKKVAANVMVADTLNANPPSGGSRKIEIAYSE